jgi:hypothetical protein
MGNFVPKRKHYRLDFTGHDTLDGLEIVLYGLSIGEFLEVQKLQGITEEDTEESNALIQRFVDHIVSWNVTTDTGIPVKPTMKSISDLDMDDVMSAIAAWLKAIAGVPVPLENGSNDGLSSLEELMATETLSPSLAS